MEDIKCENCGKIVGQAYYGFVPKKVYCEDCMKEIEECLK